jgi:hypothetical protein
MVLLGVDFCRKTCTVHTRCFPQAFHCRSRPSVFGRKLQCQPVRVNTREECHWSHACTSFKRSKGVGTNGTIECKFLSETRTGPQHARIVEWKGPGGCLERSAHRRDDLQKCVTPPTQWQSSWLMHLSEKGVLQRYVLDSHTCLASTSAPGLRPNNTPQMFSLKTRTITLPTDRLPTLPPRLDVSPCARHQLECGLWVMTAWTREMVYTSNTG